MFVMLFVWLVKFYEGLKYPLDLIMGEEKFSPGEAIKSAIYWFILIMIISYFYYPPIFLWVVGALGF